MNTLTRNTPSSRQRQQGAVAIIVGLSLIILVGMLALVLDLGHLYIAKTELQNAADAAALSGAKELDGTSAGIIRARDRAIETAGLNNYDLNSTEIEIDEGNIWVGSCPDDGSCTMVLINNVGSNSTDKTFLKVHTGPRSLDTWFAPVFNKLQTQTFGMAVAGKYVVDIAPIGVCAINKYDEDHEYGFIRGVSYNLPDLNPLGSTAVPMWINPVDSPPAACDPNNASNNVAVPFICTGRSAINISSGYVYVSTGTQAALNKSLNVRFANSLSDYNGSGCDPASAPPDPNTKEYLCTNDNGKEGCLKNPASGETGLPREWMSPDPTRQSVWFGDDESQITSTVSELRLDTPPLEKLTEWRNNLNNTRWGVLWSHTSEKNYTSPGTPYTNSDWPTLYSGITRASDPASFPYTASGTDFHQPPSITSKPNRRILNIVIIDCPEMAGESGMSCKQIPVLGVGKFFMQAKADVPKYLNGEFVELMPNKFPPTEIKLYK